MMLGDDFEISTASIARRPFAREGGSFRQRRFRPLWEAPGRRQAIAEDPSLAEAGPKAVLAALQKDGAFAGVSAPKSDSAATLPARNRLCSYIQGLNGILVLIQDAKCNSTRKSAKRSPCLVPISFLERSSANLN